MNLRKRFRTSRVLARLSETSGAVRSAYYGRTLVRVARARNPSTFSLGLVRSGAGRAGQQENNHSGQQQDTRHARSVRRNRSERARKARIGTARDSQVDRRQKNPQNHCGERPSGQHCSGRLAVSIRPFFAPFMPNLTIIGHSDTLLVHYLFEFEQFASH